jgi:hypothetical protein
MMKISKIYVILHDLQALQPWFFSLGSAKYLKARLGKGRFYLLTLKSWSSNLKAFGVRRSQNS